MKKFILDIVVVVCAFLFCLSPTHALTNEEMKDEIQNYATELSSLKIELTTQLRHFDEWSSHYSRSLKVLIKKDISKTVADAIVNKNYRLAFDTIESNLRIQGETSASDALHVLKEGILTALDHSIDYETRLSSFLNSNKDSILVADLLPLLDEVRSSYSEVRTPLKSILDTYYYAYYSDAKAKLNEFRSMSITKLDELFENLKNDLYVYKDYADILNNKIVSYKQLLKDLNLDGMGFEDLFYDDVRPYVTKIENVFTDVYHDFVEKQWTELKEEGSLIVNDTSKTVSERNQILVGKMNFYTELREKASSNFAKLKDSISTDKILEKVKKLEEKAMNECNSAIEYVRSLLLIEDFDLVLKDGVTSDQVVLDRENRYLIMKNEYDLNTFLGFIKLKDETSGILKSSIIYNGNMVGTKSKLGIYQGDLLRLTYHVILKGDVRADGTIDISDITYLIKSVLNPGHLDEMEQAAGDMNDDNQLDISDITATIKKALS